MDSCQWFHSVYHQTFFKYTLYPHQCLVSVSSSWVRAVEECMHRINRGFVFGEHFGLIDGDFNWRCSISVRQFSIIVYRGPGNTTAIDYAINTSWHIFLCPLTSHTAAGRWTGPTGRWTGPTIQLCLDFGTSLSDVFVNFQFSKSQI